VEQGSTGRFPPSGQAYRIMVTDLPGLDDEDAAGAGAAAITLNRTILHATTLMASLLD
jgi:hypothetical protein